MGFQISDGSGKGYEAKVDKDLRLYTNSVSRDELTNAVINGAGVFRANNVAGSTEAYVPILDIVGTFGFQWGIKLKAASTQKLVLEINDNVSTIDAFDCIAKGFKRKIS